MPDVAVARLSTGAILLVGDARENAFARRLDPGASAWKPVVPPPVSPVSGALRAGDAARLRCRAKRVEKYGRHARKNCDPIDAADSSGAPMIIASA
jgi:hypothetical protein